MKSLLTSTLILLASTLSAQNVDRSSTKDFGTFSVQVDRQSSGSGHANFTALGASYRLGRSSLFAGALLDDRGYKFRGVKVNYRFFPFDHGATIKPYFQYDLLARWDSRLKSDIEQQVHSEGWEGGHHEKYRTTEHYLGFGAKAPVVAGLYFDLGVGLGVYHSTMTSSTDTRIEEPGRFRRDLDASLSLSLGVGYDL